MSNSVLIDSDILIDLLRGSKQAKSHFTKNADRLCFSVITVAEIFTGIKGAIEEAEVERLFSAFPVLPVTEEIARKAGLFMQQFKASHSIAMPDALIAATCILSDSDLHTLNTKHYPMFKKLKAPYRKTGNR